MIAVTYGFLMGLPFSAFGETVVGGCCGCRRRSAPAWAVHGWRPCCGLLGLCYRSHALLTAPRQRLLLSQALLLQNGLLLFLIYYYQRRSVARAFTITALLAGAGAVALSGQLSTAHISALYDCNNLLLVASRSAGAHASIAGALPLCAAACLWTAFACVCLRGFILRPCLPVPCRLPQIWQNFSAASTGQLSLIT